MQTSIIQHYNQNNPITTSHFIFQCHITFLFSKSASLLQGIGRRSIWSRLISNKYFILVSWLSPLKLQTDNFLFFLNIRKGFQKGFFFVKFSDNRKYL